MSRNLLKATGKSRVELGWVLRLLCPSLVLGLDTRPAGPPAAWILVRPAVTTAWTWAHADLTQYPTAGVLSRGQIPHGSHPSSWHLSSAD